MQYLDFELEVSAGEAGGYNVRVLRSPAGEASSEMRMPFTGLALQNNLQALQIALLRSGATRRRVETAESQTVKTFGQELWKALFSGDVLGRFEATRGEARRQDAGVRIKLRFETPELAALPWEYLFDAGRGDYVALSEHTPVVRYIPLPEAVAPLLVQPPLRVLGMVVSPSDLPALDVDRERQRLDTALADLTGRGLVELVWMPGGTTRDLQQILRKGPWHVFHFIGHGGFDEIRSEGMIVFLDDAGKAQRVSATNLGRLLGDHDPLRLAVLNACESARGDQLDVFSSTAATLVRRGTPAVVAMQYEITDDAAIEFSRSFYEAVGSGIPVDSALADARKGVALANDGTLEWGTPVLFMRAPDGVLFDMTATAEAAERQRQAALEAAATAEAAERQRQAALEAAATAEAAERQRQAALEAAATAEAAERQRQAAVEAATATAEAAERQRQAAVEAATAEAAERQRQAALEAATTAEATERQRQAAPEAATAGATEPQSPVWIPPAKAPSSRRRIVIGVVVATIAVVAVANLPGLASRNGPTTSFVPLPTTALPTQALPVPVGVGNVVLVTYLYQFPALSAPTTGMLPIGAQVKIYCTAQGELVTRYADGASSTLWNWVGNGYVPDIAIDTGTDQAVAGPCLSQ